MARRASAGLTASEGRRFAFTVGSAFFALAALVWWRGRVTSAAALGTIGGVLVVLGIVVPTHLGPVQRGWMGLATALSKITTPVFMGVIFFGIITPMGWLLRLFGKAPLAKIRSGETAWHARAEGGRRSKLERQF